jgi:CBS domain-containing protein
MTSDVETVDCHARIGDVAARFRRTGHGAYPIVDRAGRCVGVISRGDLLRGGEWTDDAPISEIASTDVVSVAPSDSVIDALERMLEEQVDHLPVIDDGRLVGICTRTDVMRARKEQLAHEHTEPGWLRRNAG